MKKNKGLFQYDAALLTDQGSSNIVNKMLNSKKFFAKFKQSMERMGAIEVLTGSLGQIRKKVHCDQFSMANCPAFVDWVYKIQVFSMFCARRKVCSFVPNQRFV